jgi:hypothetical protein
VSVCVCVCVCACVCVYETGNCYIYIYIYNIYIYIYIIYIGRRLGNGSVRRGVAVREACQDALSAGHEVVCCRCFHWWLHCTPVRRRIHACHMKFVMGASIGGSTALR